MVPLRGVLVIGLAAGLTSALCDGIGLSSGAIAYGAVIAAVVVRPDFSRWPLAIYPVLLLVVGFCMAIGVALGLALASVPQVFVFGLVAALMQFLTLLLPGKLRLLSGVMAVAGVLPLLSSSPSWGDWGQQLLAIALGLASGTAAGLRFSRGPPWGKPGPGLCRASPGRAGESGPAIAILLAQARVCESCPGHW